MIRVARTEWSRKRNYFPSSPFIQIKPKKPGILSKCLLLALIALPGVGLAADANVRVWLSNIATEVDEGGDINYTVNRGGSLSGSLEVHLDFVPVSPVTGFNILTGGDDTDGVEKTITISDGDSSASGSLATIDNSFVNDHVRILVSVDVASGEGYFTTNQDGEARTRVTNEDVYALGVRLRDSDSTTVTVTEGDSFTLEFIRCAESGGQIVSCDDFALIPGAVTPEEITKPVTVSLSGNYFSYGPDVLDEVTIGIGNRITSYTLPTSGDDIDENDGSVVVRTFADSTRSNEYVKVTVADDDLTDISIDPVSTSVSEGADAVFRVTRSNTELLPETSVRVDLQYHTKKFTSETNPRVTNSLTFTAGQSSVVLTVPTTDNNLNDGDGMVRADLKALTLVYNAESDSTWIRVVDDEIPRMTLSVSKTSIVEGETFEWITERSAYFEDNLGAAVSYEARYYQPDDLWPDIVQENTLTELQFSIAGHIPADQSVARSLVTADITSVLVGPQGGYRQRRLLPFPEDDFTGIPKPADRTFKPRYTVTSSDWVRIDIYNSAPGVGIESSLDSVTEGSGIGFTLSRFGGSPNIIPQFSVRVRVDVQQTGDYLPESELGVRTVTMAAGETSASFQVATTGDQIDEDNGEVTVTLLPGDATGHTEDTYEFDTRYSELSGRFTHKSSVSVLDDDEPGVTVSTGELTIFEGEDAAYTVVLDTMPVDSVTVTPSRTSGDSDVTVSAALTFTTEDWDVPQEVTVSAGQDTDADDETAVIGHSVSGTGYGSVEVGSVTVNVDDDDTPRVSLSLSDDSIDEDGGVATVTASLDRTVNSTMTVTVSVLPDAPAVAGDYSLSANTSLTIAAGARESTGVVTITAVGNDVDTEDKTLQVTGNAVSEEDLGGPSDVELTLEDDETRGVRVSKTELEIDEGGEDSYTVVLDSEPTAQVTVTPALSSLGDDVTVSGPLTFTTDNWNTPQTVTVSVGQDRDAINDIAVVVNESSGGDYEGEVSTPVRVSVDDDETASSRVTLSVDPSVINEGDSAATVTVTAELNGGARIIATEVSVTVGSGTATAGEDFAAVSVFDITIPTGSTSATGTFTLTPTEDSVDEPDETVLVSGSAGGPPPLAVTGASVTIGDNDPAPTVTLSLSDSSIDENGGSTSVTASLSHVSSVATTVTVSVSPDAPAEAADYAMSSNKTLTIAAGATSSTGTVTVTGVNNDIDAADKTVQVRGAASNTLGITDPADVELTLEDDDTRGVAVSKSELALGEGEDGTYTVLLTSEPTASVTVTPSRASGDENVTVSGALTFTTVNWGTAQTVTVSAGEDTDALNDEAVIGHTVSGADYVGVTAASVDVTVDDDETASSGVTLTVSPDSVSEGASATTVTVTATLNGGTRDAATPVTVTVASGTAESGTDFAAVTGFTITIPANTASHTGTFSLTPTQDTLDEPDEALSVGGSATGLTVTGAEVVITDDDAAPTVTLSLSDSSIDENSGSTSVTASLSHASSVATTVTVSVSPDAPAEAADYAMSSNKTLTIAAGATSSTGTVTVTGVNNDIDAADKTVQVRGAANNTLGITDPADVELTLEDDDTRGVAVSKSELALGEGEDGTYTVLLTSEPTASVTVTPSRASGDENVTVSGALTFTTVNWGTAQTVTVSAGEDTDALNDEAVIGHTVSGADYVGVTAASVDVTVDDDETASSGVTLTVSPDSVSEGASATTVTVTATLNGGTRDAATPVTVTVASGAAESGTDFAAVTGFTITIPANTASHTGTFSLTPTQDTLDEPDEALSVGGSATGLTVTGAEVVITDDDAAPTVTLSLSDTSISENGGSTSVTASLSHASSVATTVTVSVSPDAPAEAADYAMSSNKTLTIAAGATGSTGTVTVTGVNNDIDAADKTVQVRGAASNTLGITDPAGVELTLEDDDTRGVAVSRTELEIDEEGDGEYTVALTSEPTGQVTVTPVRTSGDTDVTVSGALTFTATTWSVAQTVTVSAGEDTDAEDDTAVIGHTVSGADYVGVTAASVDVTVDDDETASSGVTLTVSPDSVSEGAGATPVTVTATLNGGTRGEVTAVAVTVTSDTAISGEDFAAVTGFTITIPANTASHTGTFSLTPTQDTVDEPDEALSVGGSATGLTVTGAEVVITDDDAAPTVTLSLSDASISENGGSTSVTASLSHVSSVATTVTVSVSPDAPAEAADYAMSSNKTLTIAAGATGSTGTVTVTGVNNDIDAADKTVQVRGAASNTLGITDPADVGLTLEDDDTRGMAVSRTELEIDEERDGEYTVALTSEPAGQVTVTPVRTSGDTDVTVSGPLTFTATTWSVAQTVTVSAAQDTDALNDEAVIGHTVSGADYVGVTAASVDVTVDDDETASSGVTLTVSPDSVSEGASATTVTVTATLNGGTRDAATPVTVTVASGAAESGTDFAAVTGFTITIPANTASHTGTFSLTPTQDTLDEPDEALSVGGSATGLTVTGAEVVITDDDAAPTVTLSLSDTSISENGGSTSVTASLSHASSVATTVTVSVSPDAPAEAADYAMSSNKTLTIAAGQTASTGTVTVTGVNNDIDAADKTVQVRGAASNTLGITDPAGVELTLEDDDTRGVAVSRTELEIDEEGDGEYTVALTSEPTGQVTVTPVRTSGDTDVTVSGALTFTATTWSVAQTVTVSAGEDTDAEDDTAVIGHTVSGADYVGVTAASVDVTVDDDETASSGVTLTVSPDSVSEGAGATPVTVTATLNGGTRGEVTAVAVTVTSDTAISGEDFAAVTGFTITIPANTASHTGTFSLTPTQDTLDEPDEALSVGGSATGLTVTGAEVVITDDDAAPTVTLSLSDASISENGGSTSVTASLSHASSVATTVTVSVSPDAPAEAADYAMSSNKTLTIAAGATGSTGTVTVTGVNNDIDAADKTVQVRGAASNTLGITDPAGVELTLEDDDTRGVAVSRTELEIDEEGDGEYTVALTSEPTGQVTVTPVRTSGDTDVTVSGALTFTATTWSVAQTVTVSAGEDTDAEDDTAVIGHTVSGADYVGVTAASVDVTVDDDETASSGVTLTVSPDSVSEGAGATPVTVTATLNGGTRGEVTAVAVTVTSDTAISGEDFAAVTGFTITIPANTASHTGTFSLTPTQDTVDEPDEALSVGGSATGLTVTGAEVVITDDDAAPTVTLSLSDASISENGGSTSVTASLSHASSVATTVTVSVSPDAPAEAADYAMSSNKTLTIAAGATGSTGTVTVTGVNNDIDAADKTVQVRGAASNTLGITDPAGVELTLEDDDTRGVAVSRTELEIDEEGDGEYTVALTSEPTGQVTVTPVRTSGDTDVTVSGALTFTATTWSVAQTVTVSAAQDTDALNDEAVIGHTVSGADYVGVTAASVDVTVDDDETASSGVTLTVSPDSVSEGASATTVTVTATLNGGTRGEVTAVAVTVTSDTAISGEDFAAVTGFTITIPANTASHTGTFSLTPTQDTVDEPDEALSVEGSATGLTVTGAEVVITDDDAAPTVTLSLSDSSIDENGGSASVTASLSHVSSVATTVTVSVSPDAPAEAADYAMSSNKTLTIAAGATGSTGTVTVTGVNNDIDAADKTVQVRGAASNTLGITDPADVGLTLEDDDTRGMAVSRTELEIDEERDGEYTVALTSEPAGQVTVTPVRTSGDTDVTVSGPLTFTATTWSVAQTVTVSAAQDTDALNDEAVIGHTVSGADYVGVTAASVDVTVDDDETASSGVTLTVSPDSVSEGASATTVTVTATLNGGTRDAATPVTVTVASGAAESGTDFAAVTGFTITIPANTASHTGTFSLTPTQDTLDEPDEALSVGGSATGLTVTGAEVVITDDDPAPTVTLSLSDSSIDENGGSTSVTASLSHASSVATTVTVSVSPDAPAEAADYAMSSNKTLTIAAGATSSTGTVTVTGVNNDIDAADKTVQVRGAASNTLGITDPADVGLTLEDDDTRGVAVSRTELEIDEEGEGEYTVALTSEPTGQVTVTPVRTSGDADVTVSGPLTFTATTWSVAQTVTVSAAQDTDALNDEAVIGHTVSGADYVGVTAASVDVTVDDDETASSGVTLTVSPDSVSEGASATTVTVTATLNGGTRDAATPVTVTVASGTAESGTDFAAVTGFTITIPANTASHTGTFSLTPTQDTLDEPDETVTLAGTVTGLPELTVASAQLEITDDDAAPTVTLSLSQDAIGESGGVATVTAELSHASSIATTVTVSVEPVSPATASDFSLSTNRLLTISAGDTAGTGEVTITGVDNDVDAPDKTVTVKGVADNSLGAAGPDDLSLTLEDDDERGVALDATTLTVPEGDAATYTIMLISEPTADVTVTPARASGAEDVTVSGALTFTPTTWNAPQTVTVSAAQDTDALNDEAVIGHTVSGADYVGVTAASVDVTVDDDETASSSVTLTVSPDSVSEGAGATSITVTATLNGGARDAATPVTVTVASGAAESGTDFAAVTGFTITIPANTASHTGTFSLTPTQDTLDEPDETVTVSGAATGLEVTGVEVEITDDDGTPTASLVLSDVSISENGGIATITALLNHPSSEPTTVTVSVAPDAPATSSDYSMSANAALTIAAGATGSTGTVTVTGVNNDIDAADRTVQVRGAASNTLGITDSADVELTLEDDDTRGVAVSRTELEIDEEGEGEYTVALTSEPAGQVTVTPRSEGDSDITVSGELTFSADNWSTAQRVTVSAGEDADAEDDTAIISHMVSGADYGEVAAASLNVSVADVEPDEPENPVDTLEPVPPVLTLSLSESAITENGGRSLVSAMLSHALTVPLTVEISALPESPASTADYSLGGATELTILAGGTISAGALAITASDNHVDAADKTVMISATVRGDAEVVAPVAVTLTIENDDQRGIRVSESELALVEGDSKTYTLVLNSEPTGAVTVTPSRSAGDADISVSAALTFTADNWDTAQMVTVSAAPDPDHLTDLATITHQVGGADYDGESAPSVSVTVADVEISTELALSLDRTVVPEAAGADGQTVTVTAALNHGGYLEDLDVTFTTAAGSATESTDFVAMEPKVVRIAAGQVEATATFVIVPVDDDIDEDDETLFVQATVSANGVKVNPASGLTVTITDDDTRGVKVTPAELRLRENETAFYAVVLESQPTDTVTVKLMENSSSSISVGAAELRFTPENWSTPQQVSVARESGAATDAPVMLAHIATGGGFDGVPISDVAVALVRSNAEFAAAGESLAATSRVLLNSVVGVFDGRRRAMDNPWSVDENSSLAYRLGEELYGLAALAGEPDRSAGYQLELAVDGVVPMSGPGSDSGLSSGFDTIRDTHGPGADSNWEQRLWGRSFAIPLGLAGEDEDQADAASGWTLWGASDLQTIAGSPEGRRYDGELRSVFLGADRQFGEKWLAGLTVSSSVGEVDNQFTDRGARIANSLDTRLTSLYPYIQGQLSDKLDFWAVAGIGKGEAEIESGRADSTETGALGMTLAAGGFRLGMARLGKVSLSMIGDAGHTALRVSDGKDLLDGLESAVQRVRVGIEGETDLFAVQPYWQLGARYDGGDGQTGSGIDLVAGVRYAAPRVSFEAQGRLLLLHSATGYEEFSATAALTVSAREDSTGFIFKLSPAWGQTGAGIAGIGGSMALWEDRSSIAGARRHATSSRGFSFDGEIGYGFFWPRLGGLMTPLVSLRQSDFGDRGISIGIGFQSREGWQRRELQFRLTVDRDTRGDGQSLVGLRGMYRF